VTRAAGPAGLVQVRRRAQWLFEPKDADDLCEFLRLDPAVP
jgi:hypothetical protein